MQFVALMYLSYITKRMQEKNLFKKYTMQEMLDEIDVIECFEKPEQQKKEGETTKRQTKLNKKGVKPPTSKVRYFLAGHLDQRYSNLTVMQ